MTSVSNTARLPASQPPSSVLAMFAVQCARVPERIAVACAERTLSYLELDARSSAVAAALAAAGIRRGDRVGVSLPRSEHMLVAVLGVLKAGAAYVPLDPAFPIERLEYMATHARLRQVVSWQRTDVPAGVANGRDVLELAALASAPPAGFVPPAVDADDPAYVLYTSGSTGKPKGVCVLHRNLANLLASMCSAPGMAESDVLCSITTLSFDIAELELYLPLVCGATVVIASDAEVHDPDTLLRLLDRSGTTVLQTTPALARVLLEHDRARVIDRLRLMVGGEEFPRDLAGSLAARARAVWNMYGPTETTVWSTLARVGADIDGPVSLGHPIANTVVHVLNEARQPVAAGEIGEIWIGGAGVAQGYLFQPELTAERFVPDPFVGGDARMYRTGDLGSLRNGELQFHGRVDHQVKLRGFRIELGEIEAAAMVEPGVREAVATACEFGPNDRRLVVYAVARTGDPALAGRLRRSLRTRLPYYMVPQHIEWLAELPQTPNGKIDRKALPLPAAATAVMASRGPAAPALGPCEERLAAIWRELIGVSEVRADDNFFGLGGHPLLAVEMVARVQRETGMRLKLVDIVTGSVGTLARQLPDHAAASPQGLGDRLRRLFGLRR